VSHKMRNYESLSQLLRVCIFRLGSEQTLNLTIYRYNNKDQSERVCFST
jgi:hypothetical protein